MTTLNYGQKVHSVYLPLEIEAGGRAQSADQQKKGGVVLS
jgi:hypothetical protein